MADATEPSMPSTTLQTATLHLEIYDPQIGLTSHVDVIIEDADDVAEAEIFIGGIWSRST